jgi:hypothetical protein
VSPHRTPTTKGVASAWAAQAPEQAPEGEGVAKTPEQAPEGEGGDAQAPGQAPEGEVSQLLAPESLEPFAAAGPDGLPSTLMPSRLPSQLPSLTAGGASAPFFSPPGGPSQLPSNQAEVVASPIGGEALGRT